MSANVCCYMKAVFARVCVSVRNTYALPILLSLISTLRIVATQYVELLYRTENKVNEDTLTPENVRMRLNTPLTHQMRAIFVD